MFTITGLSIEHEDSYFIIEKMDRHEWSLGEWHELLGVAEDKRLWVQWSDGGGLFVTATPESPPMGLKQLGIARNELTRMDEEHSVDNSLTYDGARYRYRNSGEAFYFQDNGSDGEGYYLWEFEGEDGSKTLSVQKWEGVPFQVYLSDVVSPDSITVYKR